MKARLKQNFVTIISQLIEKVQERSTLKCSIVHNSISLPPTEMIQDKEECPLKLKILVDF